MPSIILVIASVGFQPREYHDTKAALETAGLKVITASNLRDDKGKAVSSEGAKVKVDLLIDEIDLKTCSGIFLIGGPGALEHLDTDPVKQLMQQAADLEMPYGAICIAPRILAEAGLLNNRKATGWNDDGKLPAIFSDYNVTGVFKPKAVVIDGHVVTATGPSAATEFGEAIARVVAAGKR